MQTALDRNILNQLHAVAPEPEPPAPTTPAPTPALVHQLFPFTPLANIAANLPFVLAALAAAGLTDLPMLLAALATIRAEAESLPPARRGRVPLQHLAGRRAWSRQQFTF